jgi:hypothetical protein
MNFFSFSFSETESLRSQGPVIRDFLNRILFGRYTVFDFETCPCMLSISNQKTYSSLYQHIPGHQDCQDWAIQTN